VNYLVKLLLLQRTLKEAAELLDARAPAIGEKNPLFAKIGKCRRDNSFRPRLIQPIEIPAILG
jgi:hypothetical protein